MKLRCAKEDVELSLMFEISESTVSRVFNTWVNFLYFQLKELNTWPSRDVVSKFMPQDFKQKFPTTRVILDATEMPIQMMLMFKVSHGHLTNIKILLKPWLVVLLEGLFHIHQIVVGVG